MEEKTRDLYKKKFEQDLQEGKKQCAIAGVLSFFSLVSSWVYFMGEEVFFGIILFLVFLFVIFWFCSSYSDYRKLKKMNLEQYQKYKEAQEQQQIREAERKRQEAERQRQFEKRRSELAMQGISSCPRCGSTSIVTVRSRPDTLAPGYSGAKEILGECQFINVCQSCGQRFYPGA